MSHPDETPDATADGTHDGTPEGETPVADVARVRRAPRYRAFVWTGVLLGVLVALVRFAVVGTGHVGAALLGLVVAAGVGALLGTLVAVLADRRAS